MAWEQVPPQVSPANRTHLADAGAIPSRVATEASSEQISVAQGSHELTSLVPVEQMAWEHGPLPLELLLLELLDELELLEELELLLEELELEELPQRSPQIERQPASTTGNLTRSGSRGIGRANLGHAGIARVHELGARGADGAGARSATARPARAGA